MQIENLVINDPLKQLKGALKKAFSSNASKSADIFEHLHDFNLKKAGGERGSILSPCQDGALLICDF